MATTTSIAPALLEKGLNEVFLHSYSKTSVGKILSDSIFKFTNLTSGIQEKDVAYAGVGRFGVLGEQENIPRDEITELGSTIYDIDIFAEGVDFSYKMKLGNRYGDFMEQVSKLGQAARDTQEANRFEVIRKSTVTVGYDGKALCASDHPTATGTESNLVSSAVSYDSIKAGIKLFQERRDYRGLSISEDPTILLCPSAMWDEVVEITGAVNMPGGAAGDGDRNEVNFLSTKFPGLRVVWTPYIGAKESGGSDTHVYLISDSHKMKVFTREAINTWMSPWKDNDDIVTKFNAKYAEAAGFSDWLGIVRIGA